MSGYNLVATYHHNNNEINRLELVKLPDMNSADEDLGYPESSSGAMVNSILTKDFYDSVTYCGDL